MENCLLYIILTKSIAIKILDPYMNKRVLLSDNIFSYRVSNNLSDPLQYSNELSGQELWDTLYLLANSGGSHYLFSSSYFIKDFYYHLCVQLILGWYYSYMYDYILKCVFRIDQITQKAGDVCGFFHIKQFGLSFVKSIFQIYMRSEVHRVRKSVIYRDFRI